MTDHLQPDRASRGRGDSGADGGQRTTVRLCCGAGPRWTGHALRCADAVVVGTITGVLVDDTDGEALYAVVCFGSVSRMGEDARVIPLSLLHQDGDAFIVPLPLEAVRRAPIFVAGTCCDDEAWWGRVARHFRDAAA